MTFAILGGISAAIGEAAVAGMAATGLGTAAGAGATAGLLSAGTTAAIGSGLGAMGTGALVGSGLGAAGSALTGGDPGKGALMGAAGGAATGGLGSMFGGAGSAATGTAGNTFGGIGSAASAPAASEALSAANVLGPNSLLAGAPSSTGGLTANIGEQFAQGVGSGVSQAGVNTASGLGGAIPSSVSNIAKEAAPEVFKTGLSALPMGGGYSGPSTTDVNVRDYVEGKKAKELGSQTWGLAGGGEVALEDGQFILPADVVSALGNGSTKAGAQFLDEFFGLA